MSKTFSTVAFRICLYVSVFWVGFIALTEAVLALEESTPASKVDP